MRVIARALFFLPPLADLARRQLSLAELSADENAVRRFPAVLCLIAASVLIVISAVAVLAGRAAAGSATLTLPFASRQPCIVVLAMIPAALALLGGYFATVRGLAESDQ